MNLPGLELLNLGPPARSQSLYRLRYLFTSPRRPDKFWNPPSLLSNGYRVGRAVAQAVRRWLPPAAARVCVRAACGICGGQSGTGAGFLRVLRFPQPIIPPIYPAS
jgi:hypothetical protein